LTTYFLNRPCIYCSFLLLILFASSCHWSGRCFVDFSTSSSIPTSPISPSDGGHGYGYAEWFTPRIYTIRSREGHSGSSSSSRNISENGNGTTAGSGETDLADFLNTTINDTISALAAAAFEDAKKRLNPGSVLLSNSGLPESAGIGMGWLRSLLGRSEWTVPCVDVKIRL